MRGPGRNGDSGNGELDPQEISDALRRKIERAEEAKDRAREKFLEMSRKPREEVTHQERVRAYQAVRDAGLVDPDEGFFLVAIHLEWIAEERIMETYEKDYSDAFAEVEDGSEEHDRLEAEFEQAIDNITAATFRRFGETEMATLYEDDRPEFDRRREAGRVKMMERREGD